MPKRRFLFPDKIAIKSSKGERRVWVRHLSTMEGICQPVAAETAAGPEMEWPAVITNISRGGIGLSLGRRFEAGTPLVLELPSTNDEPSRFLRVHVIHATQQPDGTWIVGCEFVIKLSDEDLQTLD